jgi:hypothetical protein
MPREAGMFDCVVMARNIGAASFWDDVQIDDIYKFSDVTEASEMAKIIIENYELHYNQQEEYRNFINSQKFIFRDEVVNFLNIITKTENSHE